MAKCFIAMPITTPDLYAQQLNDIEHFNHVLDYLFKPAVEASGFEAVSPISSGSALIHAEIIKNIEECELMLCDVSALNPNVFFELGVRTSLDKPVAIVRDSLTMKLPFDASSINAHTYGVPLRPWLMKQEIDTLVEHITITDGKSQGRNPLWRIFGLTQRAKPIPAGGDPVEAKFDLIMDELSQLRSASNASSAWVTPTPSVYQIPVTYGNTPYNAAGAANTFFTLTNPGSVWATPTTASGPYLSPIDSAPEKFEKFTEQAKSIAAREGARLVVEGFDASEDKVIMNAGNFPLSWKITKEIASLGQKLEVRYELRRL